MGKSDYAPVYFIFKIIHIRFTSEKRVAIASLRYTTPTDTNNSITNTYFWLLYSVRNSFLINMKQLMQCSSKFFAIFNQVVVLDLKNIIIRLVICKGSGTMAKRFLAPYQLLFHRLDVNLYKFVDNSSNLLTYDADWLDPWAADQAHGSSQSASQIQSLIFLYWRKAPLQ